MDFVGSDDIAAVGCGDVSGDLDRREDLSLLRLSLLLSRRENGVGKEAMRENLEVSPDD